MTRKAKFHLPKKKCVQTLTKRKGTIVGWKKVGKGKHTAFLLLACPVGKLQRGTKRCKVGTFAKEKVKALRGNSCPVKMRRA